MAVSAWRVAMKSRDKGNPSGRSPGPAGRDGDVRVPTGKTITEFLLKEGLPQSVDVGGRPPYDRPRVLRVQGGRKYEIGPVIAQGGMGVIYEARDLNSRRVIALKVLPADSPREREDMLRFIREGQLTAQLEHPNIVPVHEIGLDEEGAVFYTMKLVEGRTLTSILNAIRKNDAATIAEFPLARLLNVFQKVCDAAAFAHSRGVLHRDLKPDNIMVGSFGEVQVMDWGLAKIRAPAGVGSDLDAAFADERRATVEDADRLKRYEDRQPTDDFSRTLTTMSGRVMGTPGFLAPEQIRKERGTPLGESADVYSLGAVLYSILTLRPTVAAGDVNMMLRRILDGDFPPPTAFNSVGELDSRKPRETKAGSARRGGFPHCPDGWIPTALSDIAMKALATRPEDRYASVQELQHAIEDYQNGYIWHLVIDEDFRDQGVFARWEVPGGQVQLLDGELRLFGGEPQVLLLKRDVAGDVRIEFECRQDGPVLNCIACFMNAIRSENCRDIPWSGYEFELGGYDNTRNVVHRFNSQMWIAPDTPLARGKAYHIVAERVGPQLRLTVNGQDVVALTDPDPLSGANRVAVGFVGWDADTRFTRIRVSTLGTPWKGDVLDLAERQIQKGRYGAAIGLCEDTLESFPDADRRRRAETALRVARQRHELTSRLPEWRERLRNAWPAVNIKLQLVNDGLSLDIKETPIGDLAPLRGLPLNILYCAHCGITTLEPLRGMPLTALDCTGNAVQTLEPLKDMPLHTLMCEDCPISDLDPLRGMRLRMLRVGLCEVSDLEPLRGMPLTFLQCWSCRIESLEPLRGMPLDNLNCSGNRIAGLEPLHGMPLTNLHCGGNRIRYLEPLRGMPIRMLLCNDNEIEDLSPLAGMPTTTLCCQCNRIADLTPLKGLPLAQLICGGNPLRDLGPFAARPPQDVLFDCDTLPDRELQRLRRAWSKNAEWSHLVREIDVVRAVRTGDAAGLKKLAAEFRGHRYLHIPRHLRWEEARTWCESMGGHLVTITSREEDQFVSSLFKGAWWFWMGLRGGDRGPEWVTGEPYAYGNFIGEMEEKCRGPKAHSRFWRADTVGDPHSCFMIEWES